jgi:hypothetical protein
MDGHSARQTAHRARHYKNHRASVNSGNESGMEMEYVIVFYAFALFCSADSPVLGPLAIFTLTVQLLQLQGTQLALDQGSI